MTAQRQLVPSRTEAIAKALEPKCRAFGKGDFPLLIAREFAECAEAAAAEWDEARKRSTILDAFEETTQRCFHCGAYVNECECSGGLPE